MPIKISPLIRYNIDGSLDTSFDGDGKVTTEILNNDEATSVTIQPDGKIVVGGAAASDFALARYNTDGSLDTTFGNGGKVVPFLMVPRGAGSMRSPFNLTERSSPQARQEDGLALHAITRTELWIPPLAPEDCRRASGRHPDEYVPS